MPQVYKIYYEPSKEDIIIYKRKTKLNLDNEFMQDIIKQGKFGEIKRQKLEMNIAKRNNEGAQFNE